MACPCTTRALHDPRRALHDPVSAAWGDVRGAAEGAAAGEGGSASALNWMDRNMGAVLIGGLALGAAVAVTLAIVWHRRKPRKRK